MNKNIYVTIYNSFIFCSVVLLIVSLFVPNTAKLQLNIAGYSILGVAILLMASIMIGNIYTKLSRASNMEVLSALIGVSGPIVILAPIVYIVVLLVKYNSVIKEGNVGSGYYTFSFISTLLMLIQLYILVNSSSNGVENISKISNATLNLVALINIICIVTIQTILESFTTDG